ncbi:MAG: antibiotic biosynthesis monooxygenase [Chloroflexota bacterium]
MEKVLIDTFIVPEESKAEFRAGALKVQSFIKTLPGFVEGFLHELQDGDSRYNFMTTAVWESEEAFENAKKTVNNENQRRGVNPDETRKRLGIERLRATYERTPY